MQSRKKTMKQGGGSFKKYAACMKKHCYTNRRKEKQVKRKYNKMFEACKSTNDVKCFKNALNKSGMHKLLAATRRCSLKNKCNKIINPNA